MKRKPEFDIAKGIAIYLVVLGHLMSNATNQSILLITFCHMPVFFWISGYFFKPEINKTNFASQILKKAKRLLVPYLIWSGISYVVNILIIAMKGGLDPSTAAEEFINIFIYSRSVWFLIMLFAADLIGIFSSLITQKIKYGKYAAMVIIWLLLYLIPNEEIFSVFKLKWLFPFFILGTASRQFGLYDKANKIILAGMGTLFFAAAPLFYDPELFAGYVRGSYNGLGSIFAGCGYYLISLLSICLVIGVSYIIRKCDFKLVRAIETAGRHSMEIYVMHMFFVKLVPSINVSSVKGLIISDVAICIFDAAIATIIVLMSKYVLSKFKLFRISIGKA